MVDAFGGVRNQIRPPERGIFPLDHDGECKEKMRIYLNCLKSNQYDHFECRDFTKDYLSCRMNNQLMAAEDLEHLGLGDNDKQLYVREKISTTSKEDQGFIAGLNVRPGKSWLMKKKSNSNQQQ